MSLINCEINLILTWSDKCIIISTNNANQGATFSITDTKRYIPVVIWSIEDNAKLLQHLKSGFNRTINRSKQEALDADPNQYRKVILQEI